MSVSSMDSAATRRVLRASRQPCGRSLKIGMAVEAEVIEARGCGPRSIAQSGWESRLSPQSRSRKTSFSLKLSPLFFGHSMSFSTKRAPTLSFCVPRVSAVRNWMIFAALLRSLLLVTTFAKNLAFSQLNFLLCFRQRPQTTSICHLFSGVDVVNFKIIKGTTTNTRAMSLNPRSPSSCNPFTLVTTFLLSGVRHKRRFSTVHIKEPPHGDAG